MPSQSEFVQTQMDRNADIAELREIVKELAVLVRATTCGGNEEQDARLQRIIARLDGAPSTPPEDERGVRVAFGNSDELHIDGTLVAQHVCFNFAEQQALRKALRDYALKPTEDEIRSVARVVGAGKQHAEEGRLLLSVDDVVEVFQRLTMFRRLGVVREDRFSNV